MHRPPKCNCLLSTPYQSHIFRFAAIAMPHGTIFASPLCMFADIALLLDSKLVSLPNLKLQPASSRLIWSRNVHDALIAAKRLFCEGFISTDKVELGE